MLWKGLLGNGFSCFFPPKSRTCILNDPCVLFTDPWLVYVFLREPNFFQTLCTSRQALLVSLSLPQTNLLQFSNLIVKDLRKKKKKTKKWSNILMFVNEKWACWVGRVIKTDIHGVATLTEAEERHVCGKRICCLRLTLFLLNWIMKWPLKGI